MLGTPNAEGKEVLLDHNLDTHINIKNNQSDKKLKRQRSLTGLLGIWSLVTHLSASAQVTSAYNSYSYRSILRMAYDYVPSGTYGRSFSGTRAITDRQWWRYQDSYNSAPYGSSKRFETGWSQPVWTQSPGPIVRANNSTRIKWQPSGNSMVDYEKSDSQSSRYSCDALFNRPEIFTTLQEKLLGLSLWTLHSIGLAKYITMLVGQGLWVDWPIQIF